MIGDDTTGSAVGPAAVVGAMAALAVVPIALSIMTQLLPSRPSPQVLSRFGSERKRLSRLSLGLILLFLAIWWASAFAIWLALLQVDRLVADYGTPSDVTVTMPPAFWGVIALWFGLLAAGDLVERLLRRRLQPDEFALLIAYMNRWQTQIVTGRTWRIIAVPLWIVGAAAVAQGFRGGIVLRSDVLTMQNFFALEPSVHSVRDATAIVTAPYVLAPNGKRVLAMRAYLIRFSNGDTWNSRNLGASTRLDQLAALVARRSGVPVTEVRLLDDSFAR